MVRLVVWLILSVFALWVSVSVARSQSIGGVTCEQVRRLTAIERKYWVWRLGLSQEQVNQIRKVCGRR